MNLCTLIVRSRSLYCIVFYRNPSSDLNGMSASLPSGGSRFEFYRVVNIILSGIFYCLKMKYAVELPADVSDATYRELLECCTRFGRQEPWVRKTCRDHE